MDLVSPVGGALGAAASAVAKARQAKPLHPAGALLPGRLVRHGRPSGEGPSSGAAWLDTAGEERVLVRLSRAGGLPLRLPDVHGLAVHAVHSDGRRTDLLLATTGLRPGLRHLLLPHLRPGTGAYTSLLPFAGPRGPLMVAAVPDPPRRLPSEPRRLASVLVDEPFHLRLGWAGPAGRWHAFGRLEVGGPVPGPLDPPLRLDPLLTPPGLSTYPWVVRIREPAYAAARRSWSAHVAASPSPSPVAPRR